MSILEKVIYLDTGLQPSCRLCEKRPLRSKRIEHGESVASIVGIWNKVAGVGAVKVVVVVLLVIERVEESSNCKTSPGGQGEQEHGAGWQHLGCPQDQRILKEVCAAHHQGCLSLEPGAWGAEDKEDG